MSYYISFGDMGNLAEDTGIMISPREYFLDKIIVFANYQSSHTRLDSDGVRLIPEQSLNQTRPNKFCSTLPYYPHDSGTSDLEKILAHSMEENHLLSGSLATVTDLAVEKEKVQ